MQSRLVGEFRENICSLHRAGIECQNALGSNETSQNEPDGENVAVGCALRRLKSESSVFHNPERETECPATKSAPIEFFTVENHCDGKQLWHQQSTDCGRAGKSAELKNCNCLRRKVVNGTKGYVLLWKESLYTKAKCRCAKQPGAK